MTTPFQFATQLAQETGDLLKTHFQIKGTQVNLKSDHSVVTEADFAANTLITDAIRSAYPDDEIISEEGATLSKNNDRPVWVIDPLDGTTNFSLGQQIWGVSIARLVGGIPDTAAINFPMLGELFTAQRNEGAYHNTDPISVKTSEKDRSKPFLAISSISSKKYQVNLQYKSRIFGSACYDICMVARGAAIIAFIKNPKIWDLAAGWLIVEEAGGVIEPYRDPIPFPLSPNYEYESGMYPTLVAADVDLMKKARKGIILK